MSLENIRQDIVTAVAQLVPTVGTSFTLKVEYPNIELINTKDQLDPFLSVDIKLIDAYQVDLSLTPTQRFIGQISLSVGVPKGSGMAVANNILGHFYKGLHRRMLGSVRTFMAEPTPTLKPIDDWVYVTMLVPFISDQSA